MKTFSTYIIEQKQSVNGFAILKPEFTKYESEFDNILKVNGWKVKNKKKQTLSSEDAAALYNIHEKEPWYQNLIKYMTSGESIGYSCSNKESKDPIKDMKDIKDQVRKEWGKDEMKNAMHSSDSLDNVTAESQIYFK